ncbi:hypothetical protein SDC9_116666 [bioreactor metagenome]|uniref:Uncharacterized protein n=1 Tax=bioreactor metagenome TaxID=1076179 RepID=A0A645BX91_9ZZZZ
MLGSGDDTGLAAGVAQRLGAQIVEGHRQQGRRLTLTGGEQHVEFTGLRLGADLESKIHQVIGGVTHRRDDDDDLVAGLLGFQHPAGNALDRLRVGNRGSAELLDDPAVLTLAHLCLPDTHKSSRRRSNFSRSA